MKDARGFVPSLAPVACATLLAAVALWAVVNEHGVDFSTYFLAAHALRHGGNVYALSDADFAALAQSHGVAHYAPPYPYPPLLAGLLMSLTPLPVQSAFALWSAANVAAVVLAGLLLSSRRDSTWTGPVAFGALALFGPIWATLYAGQANALVLLSLAAYLALADSAVLSGCALGIGLMLKPLAGPVLVHLAWRREWRRLVGAALGLALILVLSLPLTGLHSVIDYVVYALQTSWQRLGSAPVTYPPNQSLLGCFARLLAGELNLARALWLGSSAALCLGVASLTSPARRADTATFRLETGLVLVTTNLVVPLGWYHHATMSVPAIILAWQASPKLVARSMLVVAFALICAQGLWWHRLASYPSLLSLGTYGLLLTYAVTAVQLAKQRRGHVTW